MMRVALTLTLLLSIGSSGASSTDVLDFVSAMAGDLSNNDLKEFLQRVDPAMPGYSIFKEDLETLLSAKDVESEIEVIADQGDERDREVELDWVLITRDKEVINGRQLTQRVRVKCSLKRERRKWKLSAFAPIRLFKL